MSKLYINFKFNLDEILNKQFSMVFLIILYYIFGLQIDVNGNEKEKLFEK